MPAAHLFAVLLTSDSNTLDFSKVSLPLAAAAVVATLVWLLVLGIFALVTRPKPVEAAAPTMDLGPESPAVADLLVNHCHVTARAIPGTLLDLAARHYLQIEEYGTTDTIIRLHRDPTPDLTPYEKQVMQQVTSLAENGVVPIQALTLGTAGRTESWRKAFEKEVAQEAKSRGLTEDRWNLQTWTFQRLVGFVAGALVVGVAVQAGSLEFGVAVVIAAAAGAHAVLWKLFGTQKLTPAGYAAASHWLGVRAYMAEGEAFQDLPPGSVILWDRYMAYAAAFGLARATLAKMPMGAEDDHRAWSAYGGEWHNVRVRYPQTRIVWGRTPFGGLLTGVVITAAGAGFVWLMLQLHGLMNDYHDDVSHWIRLGSLVAAGVGVAIIVWGVSTIRLAFRDFGAKREVEGELVRCRALQKGQNELNYYLGVDDGKSPTIKAWVVDKATYDRMHEGSIIHATLSSNFCHVYKIDVERASRQAELPSPEPKAQTMASANKISDLLSAIAGPSVDPTTLVTADEAAAALGEPVKPAQPMMEQRADMMGLPHACLYAAASGKQAGVVVAAASGKIVNLLSRLYSSKTGDAVEIAGHQAVIHGDSIALLTEDTAVMISLRGVKGDTRATLTQLATQAAGRLTGPTATTVS
jgi:hypothetical protein